MLARVKAHAVSVHMTCRCTRPCPKSTRPWRTTCHPTSRPTNVSSMHGPTRPPSYGACSPATRPRRHRPWRRSPRPSAASDRRVGGRRAVCTQWRAAAKSAGVALRYLGLASSRLATYKKNILSSFATKRAARCITTIKYRGYVRERGETSFARVRTAQGRHCPLRAERCEAAAKLCSGSLASLSARGPRLGLFHGCRVSVFMLKTSSTRLTFCEFPPHELPH